MSSFEVGPPEFQRWYILGISCLTSALQCNTWFTFSSVPELVEEYYHLESSSNGNINSVIDLLLNWGSIMAFPCLPITAYILLLSINGLKYSLKLSSMLVFFGCFIRFIPSLLSIVCESYTLSNSFWSTLIFLHCGQILNAIAGCIVMSVPSKLSVIWFAENERKFATATIGVAGALGNCFSFLCGPYLNNVQLMLFVDLLLAFVPFVCILIYFPAHPSKLPSVAAKCALLCIPFKEDNSLQIPLANDAYDDSNREDKNVTIWLFVSEIKSVIVSKSTILMILIGGLSIGMSSAYNGISQDMLSPLGLSDKQIGTIGFIQTGMNIIGAMFVGWICDKYFAKKLKSALYVVFICLVSVLLLLLFIIPSPWSSESMIFDFNDDGVQQMIVLTVLLALCGFCNGAVYPFFYELLSEVSYPCGISEGTSSTLLMLTINLTCVVFVGLGSWMNTKYETLCNVMVNLLCMFLLFFVKETYKRLN